MTSPTAPETARHPESSAEEMVATLIADEAMLPPGPWELWTSCSYRRIKRREGHTTKEVLNAYLQRGDDHPDLSMPEDQLAALVRIRNALPTLLSTITHLAADKAGLQLEIDVLKMNDAWAQFFGEGREESWKVDAERYRSKLAQAESDKAASQLEVEGLRAERDQLEAVRGELDSEIEALRLAILGGEDAPGAAMSWPLDVVLDAHRQNVANSHARAEKAEAQLSAASARAEGAIELLRLFAARCDEAVRPDDADSSGVTVRTALLRRAKAFITEGEGRGP